jgi:hypothetical protein
VNLADPADAVEALAWDDGWHSDLLAPQSGHAGGTKQISSAQRQAIGAATVISPASHPEQPNQFSIFIRDNSLGGAKSDCGDR